MRLLAVLISSLLLPTAVAAADSTPAADFDLSLSARHPAEATALAFRIVYKNPGDPNATPSPQRRIIIELPRGTRINGQAVPICTASDVELQVLGPSACPAGSRVGGGTAELRTDGGPLFDPFIDDVDIFNGGKELVELFTHQGTGQRIGVGRRQFSSPDTLSESPPPQPGAPPDFESSVRVLDFKLASSPFITAPASCRADGLWRSKLTFDTADGHAYTVSSTTPCEPAAPASAGACRSRRTAAVVLPRGTRRVRIFLDGHLQATLRRPGRRARVSLRGLRRGLHTVVLVVQRKHGSVRITRRYRTCA